MRSRIALTVFFVSAIRLFAADVPAPTGATVVPEGAKLELVFTRSAKIKSGLTEGPACAPDGSIYFSDIPVGPDKGLIMVLNPKTKVTGAFQTDSHKSNGLKFDAKGRLVACEGADGGGRCISRYNVGLGNREVLADQYMGKRFNAPNDLVIDRKGRIYFSDPKYLGPEKRELEHMAVYRIDTDGSVVEVTHDASKPNGVALSPDEKTLYVINHDNLNERLDKQRNPAHQGAMTLYTFPLGPDGLVNGMRNKLIDVTPENGFDGMCVDEKGNLYLALRSLRRPGVLVTGPNGHEIAFIPTAAPQPGATEPVGIPSNVCFGTGGEKSTLYVTVDTSLYRIKLKIPGNKHAWEK